MMVMFSDAWIGELELSMPVALNTDHIVDVHPVIHGDDKECTVILSTGQMYTILGSLADVVAQINHAART